ncbi:MAG: hypothetical protein ACTSYL_10130 [Candidatus Thorarchaeota archaeon]
MSLQGTAVSRPKEAVQALTSARGTACIRVPECLGVVVEGKRPISQAHNSE